MAQWSTGRLGVSTCTEVDQLIRLRNTIGLCNSTIHRREPGQTWNHGTIEPRKMENEWKMMSLLSLVILLGSILVFGSSTWHRDTSVGNQSVYDGVYKYTICLGICGLLCIDPSPIWPTLNHGPYRNRFLAKIAFGVTSPSVSLWLIWCLDSFRSKPGMHWTTQVWYQFWWM